MHTELARKSNFSQLRLAQKQTNFSQTEMLPLFSSGSPVIYDIPWHFPGGIWSFFNGFRNWPHTEFNRKSRFFEHSLTIRSPRDIKGTSDWLKRSDPFLGR